MGVRESIGKAVVGAGEKIKPGEKPPDPGAPTETPGWVIFLTFVGAAVLLTMGVLVFATGKDLWENPDPPKTSVAPTKVVLKVAKKPGAKLGKKARKKTGKTRGKAQVIRREVTVEHASEGGGRSEAVALAALATGAALLLAGGFAARLTNIELPGVKVSTASAYNAGVKVGTEVGSVAGAQVAVAANESGNTALLEDKTKVVKAAKLTLNTGVDEGTMAAAAAAAIATEANPPLEGIDDQKIQEAAQEAVRTVSGTEA
jgi:hypothetical protein